MLIEEDSRRKHRSNRAYHRSSSDQANRVDEFTSRNFCPDQLPPRSILLPSSDTLLPCFEEIVVNRGSLVERPDKERKKASGSEVSRGQRFREVQGNCNRSPQRPL